MIRNKLRTTAVGVVLVGSALQVGAVNLVLNGSFENFTGGSVLGGNAPGTYPSQLRNFGGGGYTDLSNWTTGPGFSGLLSFLMDPTTASFPGTGSRDIRFSDNFTLWSQGASPDSGLYVALDGAPSYRGVGIAQVINGLVPGDTYDVDFYWAAAQQHGFDGDTTEQVQVTLGSSPAQLTPVFNLPSHGFSGWMHETFSFTAANPSEVLNFLAIGAPDGLPPFALLDGVSITANSVPEASSSLALLGLGLTVARGIAKRVQRRG